MPYFDRTDICEAYDLIAARYASQKHIKLKLQRIGYHPGHAPSWDTMSDNARDIYVRAQRRIGFPITHLDTSPATSSLHHALCQDFADNVMHDDVIQSDINFVTCEDCRAAHGAGRKPHC